MLKTEAAMEIRTHARTAMSLEMIAFVGLLIFANMHLLGIGSGRSLIFLPETFDAGEWWRLVTFPFVHVTWYHLLLDGGAFFLLYRDLEELPAAMRLLSLTLCGVTSLFAALVAAPLVLTIGLCGLSGIAHGLMALTGLRFIQNVGGGVKAPIWVDPNWAEAVPFRQRRLACELAAVFL